MQILESNIPEAMRDLKNWVLWKYEERDGRKTKVPYSAKGGKAKSNDPGTWAAFDEVMKLFHTGQYSGIGFMLSHSPFIGVDMDHVLHGEELEPWAAEVLAGLGTYAEISPSGEGIHAIGRGEIEDGKGHRSGPLEIYPGGRFLTVTGNVFQGCAEITDIGPQIAGYIARMEEKRSRKNGQKQEAGEAVEIYTEQGQQKESPAPVDLNDKELLEKIRASKQGAKFETLYDRGDLAPYGGDASAADIALMNILAFWTGKDPERMERIFSASALGQRGKWKSRDDYRGWTISKAITGTGETYSPGQVGPAPLPSSEKNMSDLLKFDMNDEGNARRLLYLYGERIRYCEQEKAWYQYNGIKWARRLSNMGIFPMGSTTMAYSRREANKKYASLAQALGCSVNSKTGAITGNKDLENKRLAAVRFFIKSDNYNETMHYINKAQAGALINAEEWDTELYKINCRNGLLDLKTLELFPHSPAQLVTKVTGAPYTPGAVSDLWEQTIAQIMPDESTRKYIQRFLGYCLTGSTQEEKFLFFYGPGGRGKGTFMETVAAAMGDYAETFSLDMLLSRNTVYTTGQEPTPELAKLQGVRLAIASESGQGRKFNEGFIKSITGGDRITARGLRRDPVTWAPQFKILIASNYQPGISDITDEGMRRRLVIVPFMAQIGKANTGLKEELHKPEHLAAVLAWMVEGYKAWQRDGLGETPPQIAQALKTYYEENDDIGDFIAERCETGQDCKETLAKVYKEFAWYQKENGARYYIGKRAFMASLANRGFPVHVGHARKRYIWGIRLNTAFPQEGIVLHGV